VTPPTSRRPLGLAIFCALAFVSALVGCFKGLTMQDALVAAHPRLAPPMYWLYVAIAPLIAAGAIGLWRMKRWGFFLTLALSAAAIAIDLWAGVEIEHPIAVTGMTVLLLAVTLPRWKLLA
jgi:uncharacterized membrane protein (DUF2068 family)